jgi:hypothetical protein
LDEGGGIILEGQCLICVIYDSIAIVGLQHGIMRIERDMEEKMDLALQKLNQRFLL